jgi:hemolysin III
VPVAAPKAIVAGMYLALSWMSAAYLPALAGTLGATGGGLMVAAGTLYSLGALAYALHRPNPAPAWFGYHEIFHLLVLAAMACFYVVVLLFVLPHAASVAVA